MESARPCTGKREYNLPIILQTSEVLLFLQYFSEPSSLTPSSSKSMHHLSSASKASYMSNQMAYWAKNYVTILTRAAH